MNNTETISFFGASVTQQHNGYAYYLSKKLKCKPHIFGYGSTHLHDAGIIYIDEVLKIKPNICFIDWFSTGYRTFNDDTIKYIDTIVYKFSTQNCKLIFLFFPRKDYDNYCLKWHTSIKEYLDKNNLSYFDLNQNVKYTQVIIRDDIHTTEVGSETYSNLIYDYFISNYNNFKIPQNIKKTNLICLSKLNINNTFKKYMKLKGDCTIFTCSLTIGPNSGYIDIGEDSILLWDQWCHYNRNFCKLNNIRVENNIEFKISDRIVDYSSCRRDYKFDNTIFELNIKDIYYIGNYLEYDEGY